MNTENEAKLSKLMSWINTFKTDHADYCGADRYDLGNGALYVEHRGQWKRIIAMGDKAKALCELVLGQSQEVAGNGYTTWALR
jgi:hypothetical protein